MQQALPWIIALAVLVVIAAGMAFWVTRPRQASALPLPTDWAVGPRAVFSVDERRAYRQLRDAFPQYIVLAKLPLIRFCQPADPSEMHYWFELLGSVHVSFAVCSAHGRVLATIDLDGERPPARRTQQIKQSVLSACRIRYLRCTIDHLPSIGELQMLLPNQGSGTAATPAPTAAPAAAASSSPASAAPARSGYQPRDTVPAALMPDAPPRPAMASSADRSPQIVPDVKSAATPRQRKERKALWQDSGLFQDSFFGIDNLRDAGPPSTLGSLLGEGKGGKPAAGSGPTISADPSQGVLESELARQNPPSR